MTLLTGQVQNICSVPLVQNIYLYKVYKNPWQINI